jgi:hypothetical protein
MDGSGAGSGVGGAENGCGGAEIEKGGGDKRGGRDDGLEVGDVDWSLGVEGLDGEDERGGRERGSRKGRELFGVSVGTGSGGNVVRNREETPKELEVGSFGSGAAADKCAEEGLGERRERGLEEPDSCREKEAMAGGVCHTEDGTGSVDSVTELLRNGRKGFL